MNPSINVRTLLRAKGQRFPSIHKGILQPQKSPFVGANKLFPCGVLEASTPEIMSRTSPDALGHIRDTGPVGSADRDTDMLHAPTSAPKRYDYPCLRGPHRVVPIRHRVCCHPLAPIIPIEDSFDTELQPKHCIGSRVVFHGDRLSRLLFSLHRLTWTR